MSKKDDEAAAFYENPANRTAIGPWAFRRIRPGVKSLRYVPPECGPRTQTVNMGMQPYWLHNPEADE